MRPITVVIALAALGATGCRSMGNAKWSSVVTQGHGRTTLGLDYLTVQPAVADTSALNFLAEYRGPIGREWDFGFRFRGVEFGSGVRRQLVRDSAVEVSLGGNAVIGAPLSTLKLDARGIVGTLEAPLRVGLNLGERSQIGLGATPKLRYGRETRGQRGLEKSGVTYSGELVLAFDIGLSDRVHLIPFVAGELFYGDASFTYATDTAMFRGGLDVSF